MQFGKVPIDEAEGGILVHSQKLPSGRIAKGRVLGPEDIEAFRADGVEAVTVARLESGDVHEDAAARRLAEAVCGLGVDLENAVGGRVNLIARHYGLAVFDRSWLDSLNALDESVTLATLEPFAPVEPGKMIATVKIIPFSVPEELLAAAEQHGELGGLRVVETPEKSIGLIQTMLHGTAEKVLDKTSGVTRQRIETIGSRMVHDERCRHEEGALAAAIAAQIEAGAEMVLVVGASAVTDRRDVIPAAITRLEGAIEHFGLPVDPGNLTLVGRVGAVPVIGVPGCARSPKENGFDWVLRRMVSGLPLTAREIAAMGSGGLLKEISSRPMPRSITIERGDPSARKIYALVLAAGGDEKILAGRGGVPNIAGIVAAVSASQANGVYVVTGALEEEVTAALSGYAVSYAYNPAFGEGLSASLRRGLSALPSDTDAVLVCLGNAEPPAPVIIDALIEAFEPNEGRALCVPVRNGRRGNPVLIGRRFFSELHELEGDVGARYLTGIYPDLIAEVNIDTSDG